MCYFGNKKQIKIESPISNMFLGVGVGGGWSK